MNQTTCPHEDAVTKAARSGEWPESLAVHAAACAVCLDAARAARWMQALAQTRLPDEDAPIAEPLVAENGILPDARLVWWKAQLVNDRAGREWRRSLAEWLQVAPLAAASLALATWVAWNWYPIEAAAGQALFDVAPQVAAVAGYALASLAPAALTLAALSLSYPLLARE